MEALRAYLSEMPALSTRILENLGEAFEVDHVDHNNSDAMRQAYLAAHARALEGLKAAGTPYYAVTYPQLRAKCPACQAEIEGAYWEVSNPVTMARGIFRARLMHDLIAHGEARYSEPIVNMSEVQMGVDEHALDRAKLAKILDGLPLPAGVATDLTPSA